MWGFCCIFVLCSSLPPRVLVLPTRNGLWQEEEKLAGKPRLTAVWVFGCLPPSRPDLGVRRRERWGLVEERGRQGRASTPAGADADPPESTVVIHRPFSEITSARGRSGEPAVRESLPGGASWAGPAWVFSPSSATGSPRERGFTPGQVSQRLLAPRNVFRKQQVTIVTGEGGWMALRADEMLLLVHSLRSIS